MKKHSMKSFWLMKVTRKKIVNVMADIPKESTVLDVGCGTGWFMKLLRRNGWNNLAGLDISIDMIKVAKEQVSGAEFYEMPVEEVSEEVGGYDVVTCLGTIHHMPNIESVSRSLSRLTRKDGVLIVHEPNKDWCYGKYGVVRFVLRVMYSVLRVKNSKKINFIRRLWSDIPPSPYHDDLKSDSIISELEKCGFVLEEIYFQDTLMRVVEGMLFRDSGVDRLLYRFVRWVDGKVVDPIVGKNAGAMLLKFRNCGA